MKLFGFEKDTEPPQATRYQQENVENEQELESILHANPECLLNEQILIISRQPTLDPGRPDLVAIDKFGNLIIFELKQGLSGTESASGSTPISQVQQYARALAPYDFDQLNELYREYHRQVKVGKWDVANSAIPAEDLDDAFEAFFSQPIKPEWIGQLQRLVVLAEEITDQTAQNARYLQEQGLNIQCQEVQQYTDPDQGAAYLACNIVVDYDLREVRPDRHGKPTYEDINRQIVDRTLAYVSDVVHAQTPDAVVDDFTRRQPVIRSKNPHHPEAIEYSLRVKPIENNTVRVALDVQNGEELLQQVRGAEQRFYEAEFEVSHSRDTNRVVQHVWEIDTVEPLYDEEMQDEIASKFAELIEIGHDIFHATP